MKLRLDLKFEKIVKLAVKHCNLPVNSLAFSVIAAEGVRSKDVPASRFHEKFYSLAIAEASIINVRKNT